ncbi:hypothetical protein KDW_34720 [Dictyobacter vulcani]|uniref:Putative zinc-finger domain-containing protein n=1 Tax=Dictyobacter vulcani TaxID=2607529 RepID=A0A5J4KS95_9CHLR|nr:zf-HC2 domain-containing protein [Dictyobacter vulcani]GER89310.1 hypothetical protein KDW_34720 [Dictyobacter vulcani]
MNCEQVKDLLSPYLDDQLTAHERQSVTNHLQLCEICNAVLVDYRRFDALLARLPRLSPHPLSPGKLVGSSASLLVYETQPVQEETPTARVRSTPAYHVSSTSKRNYYRCRYPQPQKKTVPTWITTIPWKNKRLFNSLTLLGLLTLGFSLFYIYYLRPKYHLRIPSSKEI